jgi:hypothetical protein
MPASRTRRHDPAGQAKYQDLKQLARTQARVLAGTPGVLKSRTIAAKQYWMREYIRVDGKKTDEYFGAAGAIERQRVDRLRGEIELARTLAAGSAQLRLFGYQRIDRKPAAVLAVLFNRALFHAGLTLVGSHAYGALLNELGIVAAAYRTQDVDLARGEPLSLALPDGATFESLLRETALAFVPVPRLRTREASTSYKLPGAHALTVDLLAPGRSAGEIVPVKELAAHAQAIPFLDYLVDDAIDSVVLSPNQVIPVRIPAPERFAVHKLFSSQSRRSDRDKIRKDLEQAALLASAVEEETPERLGQAHKAAPAAIKAAVRRGARAAARLLEGRHGEGRAALLRIAGRQR